MIRFALLVLAAVANVCVAFHPADSSWVWSAANIFISGMLGWEISAAAADAWRRA
jgi:hypothetical protein